MIDYIHLIVFTQPGRPLAMAPLGSLPAKTANSNLSVSNLIATAKGHRKAVSDTSSILSGGDQDAPVKSPKTHRRNQLSESLPNYDATKQSEEQLGPFEV